MIKADTLVIGAGLAGLTVARHLADAGQRVIIVEKSRSPGGRLSTRRSDFGDFDHGAQYLTGRTAEFNAVINRFAETGELAPWKPQGKDSAQPWWVGRPGMSAIGTALAAGIDLRPGQRATRLERRGGSVLVEAEDVQGATTRYSAGRVVIAAPAPQTHDLIGHIDPAFSILQQVSMAPCWAAMVSFENPVEDMPDVVRGGPGDVVGWVARNGSKPGRRGETFVLHAASDWSRLHLDDDKDVISTAMLAAFNRQGTRRTAQPVPTQVAVHRWLYALADAPLGAEFVASDDQTLFACGDWCLAARAEAAHQSGLALARHILSL